MPRRRLCPDCRHRAVLFAGRCSKLVADSALCGCPCSSVPAQRTPAADRLPTQAIPVVEAIRDGHTWGTAIIAETGASMTAVYATLRRLRETGWLVDGVEDRQLANAQRRPQRTLYRLTAKTLDALGRRRK